MGEENKEESSWKKFKAWVKDGSTSVYTKENMNALKAGFNVFLITAVGVLGLFVFSYARKIENELHSIGIMQMWAATATMLGIVVGVFFGSVKKSTEMLAKKSESMGSQAGIDMPDMDTSEFEKLQPDEPKTSVPEAPKAPEPPPEEPPISEPTIPDTDDPLDIPEVPEIVNE
jgi:hypothetical protein